MEIDSGAAASVITEQFFNGKLSNCALKSSYKKFNFFDGTSIQPVGQFTAKVEFNNKIVDCEFIVVKSTGNPYPLCGRNLLSKLGISWVQLNNIQDSKKSRSLNELLVEYKDLFSGKLGEYAHMEVHLELNSDIQPILHKHRCIPFAHKLAVEKELQRLEESGVIKKRELCQWGTPLVPVLKPDCSIRLCSDYKATINRYIKDIHWSKICDKAFNKIKTILMSEQVLTHYNPDLPIVLTRDASNNGLGAVLSHVLSDNSEKPIHFASRALSSAEKKYSTTHKDALAVVWGVTKNYQYLKGREFTIKSDHKPLMTLLDEDKVIPKMASGRVQRWEFFLSGFKYKIEFIKGTNNKATENLSRISISNNDFITKDDLVDQALDVISFVDHFVPVDYLQISSETSKDPTVKKS
ncbi:unnamed protein product [Macrosiphum euphorbiae]|uniref:Reverse transcriptase/retrotransposon-derived protein RNase H-like domain-containing protein n=1 Tax=Macrosiphum euphorbiae TaxID=13131 RepID=A0AAV0VJM7_9HEMI|nr:unnamed protein product [Macrosiphum euphorbiae]